MRPYIFKLMDAARDEAARFSAWVKARGLAADDWITLSGRDSNGDKHGGARVLLDDSGAIVYGLGGGHAGKKLGEALHEIKVNAAAQRGQGLLFSDMRSQARKERKQAKAEKEAAKKQRQEERKAAREAEKEAENNARENDSLKYALRRAVWKFGLKGNRDQEVENALKRAAEYAQENKDAEQLTGVRVAMEGGLMGQVIAQQEGVRIAKPEFNRLRKAQTLDDIDRIRDEGITRLENRLNYSIQKISDAQLALYVKQGDKLTTKQRNQFKAAYEQVRHNYHIAQNRFWEAAGYARENLNDEADVPF